MSLSPKRLLAAFSALVVLVTAAVITAAQPAMATMDPSFKVTCYGDHMAQDDPIVFPGQPGKAHMHTFYGMTGVDANTTVDSLLATGHSNCGSHFDGVDMSAYWIPTLYKNGQAVFTDPGSTQLQIYYRRAGGPGGDSIAQAFPRGLRMIAGDMHATTPQSNVSYACAKSGDTGNQRGGTSDFMDCASDEVLIARLVFPDCWDGVNLDSADHKSHMAYSSGPTASCPADHPVKLPQITFEAWYFNVDLSGGGLAWASGGPYSFHGDVISAWDTTAAANLVNQCINVAFDCNPLMYEAIPTGAVSQAQIDAQLTGTTPAPTTGTDDMAGMPGMETPTATPAPTPTPTPAPAPAVSPTSVPTSAPVAEAPAQPSEPAPHVHRWWGDLPSWASTWRAWLSHLFASWGWGLSV